MSEAMYPEEPRIQNTHVPIFKLPDDILESVFLVSNGSAKQTLVSVGNARQISQVCLCWRILALSIPKLWNLISLNGGTQWHQELLRRSAGCPHISISSADYDSFDHFLTAQPDIVPRIRLLSTSAISDRAWDKLLTSGAQLEEIHLVAAGDVDGPFETVFHEHGPPLRVFKLVGGDVGHLSCRFWVTLLTLP